MGGQGFSLGELVIPAMIGFTAFMFAVAVLTGAYLYVGALILPLSILAGVTTAVVVLLARRRAALRGDP